MRIIDADALLKTIPSEDVTSRMAIINSPTISQWIQISEKYPNHGEDVIVCDIEGDIYLAHLANSDRRWFFDSCGNKIKNVTAWMPLPEPFDDNTIGVDK